MPIEINNLNSNVFVAGAENRAESLAGNHQKARPALVFLHYFGGSSRAWTEVIAALETDFYCLAPDLRGFGASQDSAGNHRVADYADDLDTLLAIFKLKNYALVGHSMGGKIALEFAARRPAELQSLILLAPSPPTPEPIDETERTRLLTTRGEPQAAAETVRRSVAQSLPSDVFARAVADNLRTSETAWRAWLEIGSKENISQSVAQINVPVLVAGGEKDEKMTTDLLNREIVRQIKNTQFVTIPGVKHLLPLEAPGKIADLINRQILNFS